MRITIVVDDNMVIVQGHGETVDCAALIPQGIHAVQWFDCWGEIEYSTDLETSERKPNARITDFSPFQFLADAWEIEAKKPAVVPTARNS